MIKNKILALVISLVAGAVIILTLIAVYDFSAGAEKIYNKDSYTIINSIKEIVELKIENTEGLINYVQSTSMYDSKSESDIKNKLIYMYEQSECKSIHFYNESNKKMTVYPNSNIEVNNYEDTEWYKEAKKTEDKVFVTDVYVDTDTGEKIVTIGKSIFEDGQFKGIICVNYNLRNMFADISNIKFGDNGKIIILDENKVIISCTDNHLIGSEELADDNKNEKGIFKKSLIKLGIIDSTNWTIILQMPDKEYNEARNDFIIIMLIVMCILIVVSSIGAIALAGKMGKKILMIKEGIQRGSKGDFSRDVIIKSKDEFGSMAESFNRMQKSISKLVSITKTSAVNVHKSSNNLYKMSGQVSKAMDEVLETMTDISEGSTISAENLETLLRSLDSVSNQISDINELSETVGILTKETDNLSSKGIDIINIVMDKYKDTKDSTEEVTEVVLKVEDNVKNIAVMNDTISEITEQTNLLALNAAIEAARAGDSGKGFAVVAEEIRALAEQTAVSAKNIDDVISEVVSSVENAVKHVKYTNNIVEEQQQSVINAKEILDSINIGVNNLLYKFENIIELIKQVSDNKEAIVSEAHNISAIVDKTASETQEAAASSEEVTEASKEVVVSANELHELSDSLNKEINKFKLKDIK